jgi:hypothetical protein
MKKISVSPGILYNELPLYVVCTKQKFARRVFISVRFYRHETLLHSVLMFSYALALYFSCVNKEKIRGYLPTRVRSTGLAAELLMPAHCVCIFSADAGCKDVGRISVSSCFSDCFLCSECPNVLSARFTEQR